MKHQIATTPEQSRRLIACGVNPDSADMCYVGGWSPVCAIPFSKCNKEDTPAWSLSALLELLPMEVNEEGLQTVFHLTCYPDELKWAAEYYDYAMDKHLCSERDYTPIVACVKAIEWLTANGYTLNTK